LLGKNPSDFNNCRGSGSPDGASSPGFKGQEIAYDCMLLSEITFGSFMGLNVFINVQFINKNVLEG
jgi:hypothetical protein